MFEWLEVLNVSLVLLLSNLFTVGTNNNLGLWNPAKSHDKNKNKKWLNKPRQKMNLNLVAWEEPWEKLLRSWYLSRKQSRIWNPPNF